MAQLRQEIAGVTSAFKTQIHSLQEDHHRMVEGLKEELQVRAALAITLNRMLIGSKIGLIRMRYSCG